MESLRGGVRAGIPLSSALPAHQLPLSFLASDKPALPLVPLGLELVAGTVPRCGLSRELPHHWLVSLPPLF